MAGKVRVLVQTSGAPAEDSGGRGVPEARTRVRIPGLAMYAGHTSSGGLNLLADNAHRHRDRREHTHPGDHRRGLVTSFQRHSEPPVESGWFDGTRTQVSADSVGRREPRLVPLAGPSVETLLQSGMARRQLNQDDAEPAFLEAFIRRVRGGRHRSPRTRVATSMPSGAVGARRHTLREPGLCARS
jgi:hypothetical protein